MPIIAGVVCRKQEAELQMTTSVCKGRYQRPELTAQLAGR